MVSRALRLEKKRVSGAKYLMTNAAARGSTMTILRVILKHLVFSHFLTWCSGMVLL